MKVLTAQQREFVLRHVGLVKMHVSRQMRRMAHLTGEREREDMLQEGLVGLMEAASRYNPQEHGAFSAYALLHIHGAICRHLMGQMDGLAVPERAVKQIFRRRKWTKWWRESHPSEFPHFYSLDSSMLLIMRQVYDQYRRSLAARQCLEALGLKGVDESDSAAEVDDQAEDPGQQVEQQLRERYEQAVHWAAARLKSVKQCRPDRAALIDAFVEERLLVPDPRYRTSKRSLARRFACSLGRLDSCQRRFCQLIREHLMSQHAQRATSLEVIGRRVGPAAKAAEASTAAGKGPSRADCLRRPLDAIPVRCEQDAPRPSGLLAIAR